MRRYGKQFWRTAPFIRLLIPLTAGIVLSHYTTIDFYGLIIASILALLVILFFSFFHRSVKYKWRWLNGASLNVLLACLGCLLMYFQDITNDHRWIGHYLSRATCVCVTLREPLTVKANSSKTLVRAESVLIDGKWITVKGDVLIYFKKDSLLPAVQYGAQLIIQKKLQPISNPGNPGGFDYKQYCAYQDIHYQAYLKPGEYYSTGTIEKNQLTEILISMRATVLSVFRKWVPGETEMGVAEALLIGYRDDLDKDLIRSYSNTGVIHIIAISGLHLGLIYGLMLLILKPFKKKKWMRWAKPLLILFVLWGFSLLAGAAASILRSVVMFSFIVIGESLGRRTNIYNTLAASAFCLLVYDPYFFWDVGFQLSYTAVVSIVLFMKPIYRCLYFKNKLLNMVWELNAISMAAQVFTLPILLFYFHQFPNLFLITNFVAVPLSGFILYGELLLLVVYKIPLLNTWTGNTVSFIIRQMDHVISSMDHLPFSVTDSIHFDLAPTILLYFAVSYFAWWLLQKKNKSLLAGLFFLSIIFFIRYTYLLQQQDQHKMIIYNIPQHKAIDLIDRKNYLFAGDTSLAANEFLVNFHLRPARVSFGAAQADSLSGIFVSNHYFAGPHQSVLLVDGSTRLPSVVQKIPVDIIVLSGNPKIRITQLAAAFDCHQYVFDSSNPLWKIQYWKKDADSLHLRHHTVAEQGAFETDL